jgi:Cu-Zn family superoxide dismutase
MRRTLIAVSALTAAGLTLTATAAVADHGPSSARATLRLADGTEIGRVRFREHRDTTEVTVKLEAPPSATARRAYHGFHIHANDNPANGTGCQADPAAAPATWFVSADGHLKHDGEVHGGHSGDLPSLHLDSDGTATATFSIDRIDIGELAGRVVILHAGPDNFGNVPVGTQPTQYTANGPEAIDLTGRTGNAGDRVACGEITVR